MMNKMNLSCFVAILIASGCFFPLYSLQQLAAQWPSTDYQVRTKNTPDLKMEIVAGGEPIYIAKTITFMFRSDTHFKTLIEEDVAMITSNIEIEAPDSFRVDHLVFPAIPSEVTWSGYEMAGGNPSMVTRTGTGYAIHVALRVHAKQETPAGEYKVTVRLPNVKKLCELIDIKPDTPSFTADVQVWESQARQDQ